LKANLAIFGLEKVFAFDMPRKIYIKTE